MRKLGFILFLLVSFAACKAKKEAAAIALEPVKPEWVGGKPISSFYYSGIGAAPKSTSLDYKNVAKNNALNDLASEISVTVNSTSNFYQFEQDEVLRNEFKSTSLLRSKENIEGFELVETYENATEYWVYYRLEKDKYEQIKRQRIDVAVALSKQYYAKALAFKDANQYADAIKFGVKALAAIKDFMGEPLKTTWQEREVYMLPELYGFLQETTTNMRFAAVQSSVHIKRGLGLSAQLTSFLLTTPNGQPIAGMPIYMFYTADKLPNNQLQTNAFGLVNMPIQRVSSKNEVEYLQANLNMVSLVTEATDDAFLRKFLSKLNGPEARLEIWIDKPKVAVVALEQNLDEIASSGVLANAFVQQLLADNMVVAKAQKEADYVLIINAKSIESGRQGQFFTATLNANFSLQDANGNLLYEQEVLGFKGMHTTPIAAGQDAYRKLAAEIAKRYYREMRRKVFD